MSRAGTGYLPVPPPEPVMQPQATPKTLIVVATYKERENIGRLLESIMAQDESVDFLVIDDASPDGTGELVDAYAARDRRVHVLHRAGKLGLGTAILDGLKYAMANGYEFAISMDADFSHSPQSIPDLLAGMKDHDVMIGSRYVPGGGISGWPWTRKAMSRAINWYTRLLFGIAARDCSGGFRCYRLHKIRQIDLDRLRSRGYSFQEEFLYRCGQAGCRIGETPIHFENRKVGKSKINWKEALWALWTLLHVAIRG